MAARIGYARVSTHDQQTFRQVDELRAVGCDEVLEEKASGADRQRPVLAAILRRVHAGDTLVVTKLDRLARSLDHLLEVVRTLEGKRAYLRVLGDPIDTATPQGRFMLQMLGAVAEFERALIRERVTSGLARAAREGRCGGNPGLRDRDPNAIRRLQHAREDAYMARILTGSDAWLTRVLRLREQGKTWDEVTFALNAAGAGDGGQGAAWTKPRLVRAVKAMAREGLVAKDVVGTRGRRSSREGRERDTALRAVSAMIAEAPGITLREVGERLTALRCYPPRGGTRWSTSSIAHLVTAARKAGLLQSSSVR